MFQSIIINKKGELLLLQVIFPITLFLPVRTWFSLRGRNCYLTVAEEGSLGDLGKDGVIVAGNAWDK
mgnify:FL=1